ncbi:MAG: methyltransferase domain-containing protein [Thermomicrobiales bacterium]|nr:methyltransferase domain-containing protein [Thermomicrobiales bacterium]
MKPDLPLPEHVQRNRTAWDEYAAQYAEPGRKNWAASEPTWGIFSVPESRLRLLPEEMTGMDAVELGCGTAYVSAWMARRGARPVGIDNSPKQLETAQALQQEHGLDFPLHLGNAESTPFEDESFDFAISEYGAAIWCDPYQWIPEAARILKPGGQLVFLGNGLLLMLATPPEALDEDAATTRFERPLFGMHRFEWTDTEAVEFHLPHGKMIALLRDAGFEIEELIEVEVPHGSQTTYPYVTLEWAQQWPCEEVWKVRKRR